MSDGVIVSGLTIDAGKVLSEYLLQAGEPGSKRSHASDPVFLYDIFCQGRRTGMKDPHQPAWLLTAMMSALIIYGSGGLITETESDGIRTVAPTD